MDANTKRPRYPDPVEADVQAAERQGHQPLSQGCGMFRCGRCNVRGYLDNAGELGAFGDPCKGEGERRSLTAVPLTAREGTEEVMHENRYQQAIDGLGDLPYGGGVVVVRDGHTYWLCSEAAWDHARDVMRGEAPLPDDEGGAEAYTELCRLISRRSAVAAVDGGSTHGAPGEQADLVARALEAGIIDADLARGMGVFTLEIEADVEVYDYATGTRLDGEPSAALTLASLREPSGTGAVGAHLRDGIWQWDHGQAGERTVYVMIDGGTVRATDRQGSVETPLEPGAEDMLMRAARAMRDARGWRAVHIISQGVTHIGYGSVA